MEVGLAISDLIESLDTRKKNKFLSLAVQKEIEGLIEKDVEISKTAVLMTTSAYYGE